MGRFLPSDTVRVPPPSVLPAPPRPPHLTSKQMKMWKRGNRLRLDCSLGPFRGLKWRRGRLSFMFFGDNPDPKSQLVIVDHINQRFTRVWPENTPEKSLGRCELPVVAVFHWHA